MSRKPMINMKAPHTFFDQFLRDCILFFRFPKDFLLTFHDPLDKVPQLKEVNEEAHKVGKKLLKELKSEASEGMRIYFVGSNFFKLPGISDDIDFLVEYSTEDERSKWEKVLSDHFGKPVKETNSFIKWETTHSGYSVEAVLSNPRFPIFRKIYDSYYVLNSDPDLLAEYEELKRNSTGVTAREYTRRQLYFFECYALDKLRSKHANTL